MMDIGLVNILYAATSPRAGLPHQLVHPVPVLLRAATAPADHGEEDSRCHHCVVKLF